VKYYRVYAGTPKRPPGFLGCAATLNDAIKIRGPWAGTVHVQQAEMSREAAERILRRGDYADMMRIARAVLAEPTKAAEDIDADTARK
jgi:2,4-dienoyl-CoA reductase-like NADH-dependent reductase (Old Yellow Enzyme family)